MVSLASGTPTLISGVYYWNIQDTFTNSLGQKFTQIVYQWNYKQIVDNGLGSALPQYAYLINTTAGGYTVSVSPPSPPSLSTSTVNATTNDFKINVVTQVGTVSIDLQVKYPNGTSFIFFGNTPSANLGAGIGIHLPLAANGAPYGTYSFQAIAYNSSNQASQASNIVTITVNAPVTTSNTGTIPPSNSTEYYVKYLYGGTTYEGIETLAFWVGNGNFTVSGTTYTNNQTTTLQILASSGTLIPRVAVPGYVPPPDTSPITTFTTVTLKIIAINGVTQNFTVKLTDWTAFQTSGGIATSQYQLISNNLNQTSAPNTINDIGNFLTANSSGGTTPPPPAPTPAPTNFQSSVTNGDIALTWTSAYPVTLTVNGSLRVNNYSANAYSMFGQPNGTYVFTLFATNNGVNSSVVQITATVNYTPPPPTQSMNYTYDIQYVANSNTPPLRLFTLTNYGTGTSISFPARSFVQSKLNITNNNIPTTLNAIVQPQVPAISYPANETTIANYLNTYFAGPPVTTPKRDLMSYAKGILAIGLTSSLLIGSGFKPNRKRKR